MFEIDVKGMSELEGGREPYQLAAEAVVNVFDEYRRLQADGLAPTFCGVTLAKSENPRGVLIEVTDDGQGFENLRDVWTLFGTTAKRSDAGLAGRFNLGEKQLIAAAIEAVIESGDQRVTFRDGERKLSRWGGRRGVRVSAVMPWRVGEIDAIRDQLLRMIPPAGLVLTVNGVAVKARTARTIVRVTLPTVRLADGVMRQTNRQTSVAVYTDDDPHLYELGSPVCSLKDVGFPWSLDVGQKIPLPPTRDVVGPAYLARLIGSVVEAATMDGVRLLTEEQQGAGFLRDALEWVREPEALAETVKAVFGDNAVRQSSDALANAQAAAAGALVVPGRWFGAATRERLQDAKAMPVASAVFGGSAALKAQQDAALNAQDAVRAAGICPACGQRLP